MPKQTTAVARAQVVGMWQGNSRQLDIAEALDIAQSSVSRIVQRFLQSGSTARRKGSGRPRTTTPQMDRYIIRMAKKDRKRSASSIQAEVSKLTDHSISRETINRRLVEGGYHARRPQKKPKLSKRQKQLRLAWAQEHRHWGDREWRKVVFTDESSFQLHRIDRRQKVRRTTGEALRNDCVEETVAHGGGSVLVWGAVSMDAKSKLVILESNVNGQIYRQLLEETALPFARRHLGNQFYYQDDNARPHRHRLVKQYMAQEAIRCLPWPAQSPDLNVAEDMWNELGRRIQKRDPPLNSLQQLRTALQEEWDAIPQDYPRRLIGGMPRRVKALLKSRGSHTRY